MDEFIKLLDKNLEYVSNQIIDNTFYINVISNRKVSVKVLVPPFIVLNVLKYPSKAKTCFTRINFISYL